MSSLVFSNFLSLSGPTDPLISGTDPLRVGVLEGEEAVVPFIVDFFPGVAKFPFGGDNVLVDGMFSAGCSSCVETTVDPCSDTVSVVSSTIPAMARRCLMYFCNAGRMLAAHAVKCSFKDD